MFIQPIVTLPRDSAILADHARAKAALQRRDLQAAKDFLTGERFTHRSREVEGMSWGELTSIAAHLVLAAHAQGTPIEPEPLYQAHIAMTYAYDLPLATQHLHQAMHLLDTEQLKEQTARRRELVTYMFPKLLLYRYLDAGGRLDWSTDLSYGLYYLYFRSPQPAPGEHDPREFYRFLPYLSMQEREWLFAYWRFQEPLDEVIWRDEEKLRAFSRAPGYYHWLQANGLDWLLESSLSWMGNEQECFAHLRGYQVNTNKWGQEELDRQTCLPLAR